MVIYVSNFYYYLIIQVLKFRVYDIEKGRVISFS